MLETLEHTRQEVKHLYGEYQTLNTKLINILCNKHDKNKSRELQNSLILIDNQIAVQMTAFRTLLDQKIEDYLSGPESAL